jgi:glycosyltransferase involved in cell wall biosynthesis
MLRFYPKIVAVSNATRNDYLEKLKFINNTQISTIYNGLNESFFNNNVVPRNSTKAGFGPRILLHVGVDRWYKNLSVLIAAIQKLQTPIIFVKVGKLSESNFKLLNNCGIEYRIVEECTQEELVELYISADVFAFPSLSEGFGWPPIESMACGCPVVASPTGSIPEICKDACLYADPNNPGEIANAIDRVLTDSLLYSQMSNKGLLLCKEYTWSVTVKKMILKLQEC